MHQAIIISLPGYKYSCFGSKIKAVLIGSLLPKTSKKSNHEAASDMGKRECDHLSIKYTYIYETSRVIEGFENNLKSGNEYINNTFADLSIKDASVRRKS